MGKQRRRRGDGRTRARNERRKGQKKPLAKMGRNETGTVEMITDGPRDRLRSMGIRSGKRLVVQSKQPFRGPITVSVDRQMTSLSYDHARHVYIGLDDS